MKKDLKTTLNLFLSTGNKIVIYFVSDCMRSVEENLQEAIRLGSYFPAGFVEVEQMIINDSSNRLVFFAAAGDPMCIDTSKIIGWSIEER